MGCIYTAQGFEYDYAGVIIVPDLVWRDGGWLAVREGSKDPAFRSRTAVSDTEFDRSVRQVCKVLLARGMRVVGIYCTDKETRALLGSLV